jgi:hypothetical protein
MTDFSTQKITLNGKHKQLVDLNKDNVNFNSEFTITPHILDIDKEYFATIATQTQLDNGEEIDFNKLSGIYTGSVKNDSNEYQNYFLVIKSDAPMREMSIENKLDEIVLQQPPQQSPPRPSTNEHYQRQKPTHADVERLMHQQTKSQKNHLKYILAFFIVLVGCFLLYYFWKKGKDTQPKKFAMAPECSFPSNSLPLPSHNIPLHNLPSHNLPSHNLPSHNLPSHNLPSRSDTHPLKRTFKKEIPETSSYPSIKLFSRKNESSSSSASESPYPSPSPYRN